MAETSVETSAERYLRLFDSSEQQHLKRVRKLRREIRQCEDSNELDLVVLGITGSEEELKRYRTLAQKIGENIGQPLIVVKKVEALNGGREARGITEARAGIIASEVEVETDFDETTYWGGPKNYFSTRFKVPVDPEHFVGKGTDTFWFGYEMGSDRTIEVANLRYDENKNRTTDPENDYQALLPRDNVLVGREEIYRSKFFELGAREILLALEVGRTAIEHLQPAHRRTQRISR